MSSCSSCPEPVTGYAASSSGFDGCGISLADYLKATQPLCGTGTVSGSAWTPVCNDPSLSQGIQVPGTALPSSLTTQEKAVSMVLLGRNGNVATRLYGFGFLYQNGDLTEVRNNITLSVSHLWHNWWVPGDNPSALPIPGNPKPFPFLVVGSPEGIPHLLRGLKDDDSETIWNYVAGQWEVRAIANREVCVKKVLAPTNAVEIIGFDPLLPAEPTTKTRCLKRLSGTGLVVLVEQMTTGTCTEDGVEGPCATQVAYTVPFGEVDKKYLFEWHSTEGPRLVEYVEPEGSGGGSGDNGEDGDDGDPGPQGPPGVSIQSAIVASNGHLILTLTDGTTKDAGYVKGPQGPKGNDGVDGGVGPAGADGVDGDDGVAGADGDDGADGAGFSPTAADLLTIYTPVQTFEYLANPVEISGANRDVLLALHQYIAPYHTGHGGTIALPSGTDLLTIDHVIVRVAAVSTDVQQEEVVSATHSVRVRLNVREVLFLDNVDSTAAGTDPGNLYPRQSQLTGAIETAIPYAAGAEITVQVDSVKFPTSPAGSQFSKYYLGKNRVRVYVVGFVVTRKKNPALM